MSDGTHKLRHRNWFVFYMFVFSFIALPYIMIYATPFEEWRMRMVSNAIFCAIFPIFCIVYGLHPKTKVFREDDDQASHQHQPKNYDLIVRVVIIAFGLAGIYFMALPYWKDLISLTNGNAPLRLTGQVSRHNDTKTFYIYQTFRVRHHEDIRCKLLYFPLHRLESGDLVNMLVLPYSGTVVSISYAKREEQLKR